MAQQLSGEAPASVFLVGRRNTLLEQALAAAQTLGTPDGGLATALAAVAQQLSGEARRNTLEQALAAAQAIRDERQRAEALVAASRTIIGLGAPGLAYAVFARVIDIMRDIRRPRVLEVIRALSPTIGEVGGESALLETAQAISNTTGWWP